MRAVQVQLTDKEIEKIDGLVNAGYSKSRADFVRKAAIEYFVRVENSTMNAKIKE